MTSHRNQAPQALSRRDFMKVTALAAGAAGALAACDRTPSDEEAPRGRRVATGEGLPIQAAGYPYNRAAPLFDGRVEIEGCALTIEPGKIGDMNAHIFDGPQTRDITEIGLHPFMLAYANQDFRDYTLLPIFPLRVFRHKSIFIRNDRGIDAPGKLRGKRIGTPGYSSTSLTWIRGVLEDEYGVKPEDVQWVIATKDSSAKSGGQTSKQESVVPEGLRIESGPEGKDESDLLETGEVDALFHAIEPRAYAQGHPKVARLFPDPRATEQAYYKKTGIFPIMHAVAVKQQTLQQNPWLAEAVFRAYSRAKQMDDKFRARLGWAYDSLPWYGQELEETRAVMGDNYYSYGIGPNRKTLEALFRYSHQQGLASRELTVEELFHPSSLEFEETTS